MKRLVDKPNSVLFHSLLKQSTKRGNHFSWRPTHPVFTCVNWSGQLSSHSAFAQSETGSTWSCTKRGFSCPDVTNGHIGIAYATIIITDNAVVSYTTFSPVSRFLLTKKSGCVFSVILSVPTGYSLQDPRFLRLKRTREAPCLVVFGLSSPSCKRRIERLPDAPASASGPNVQSSQQKTLSTMW
jgi:hypothetical protein